MGQASLLAFVGDHEELETNVRKTFTLLFYFVFLLLVAELALRLGSHFLLGTPVLDIRRFRSDPYTMWRFNPGFHGRFYTYRRAWVNSLGYLGPEIALPKPNGRVRVVALGGSVTFGYGVSEVTDNFCANLWRFLDKWPGNLKYEVVNAGVPGYTSWNGRQWVEHYLADLQPDVLLVAFGWNDSLLDTKPDADPSKRISYHNPAEFFPYNISLVAGLVKRAWMIIAYRTGLARHISEDEREGLPVRVSPDEFRANLTAISDWCRSHHVKLLFWTEPEANLAQKNRAFARRSGLHAAYLEATRQSVAQLGVPLADVAQAFSGMGADSLFADPHDDYVHPDKRGQAEMARIIYETLVRVGYYRD